MDALHITRLLMMADANPAQATSILRSAQSEIKWLLRETRERIGTTKTTETEHTCPGVVDDYRVYRDLDERDDSVWSWKAEIVPGDWLYVTHCPWCGTLLERDMV